MKKFQKMIIVAVFIMVGQVAQARHKDQIFILNNYGKDVTIALEWKNKSYPYDTDQVKNVKKNNKIIMIKAPYSTAHLSGLIATPTINIKNQNQYDLLSGGAFLTGYITSGAGIITANPLVLGIGGTIIASSIVADIVNMMTQSHNNHIIINAHKHTFFVIEKTNSKSDVSGQNKIAIRSYASQEQYEQEIGQTLKAEIVEIKQEDLKNTESDYELV